MQIDSTNFDHLDNFSSTILFAVHKTPSIRQTVIQFRENPRYQHDIH